jgi:uncharacterized protein YggT (Ycf19 family)
MGLLDFILNLVALLLWLNWRSIRFDPLTRRVPATLVGTLRPAEPRRLNGWQWLVGLGLLLSLRALVYRGIGEPVHWTPKLDLGVVVPALRGDKLELNLLYSGLSFLRVFVIFYFWLAVLAAINHRTLEPEPVLKVIRLHLGRSARWPWPLGLALPILLVSMLWLGVQPLLVHFDMASQTRSSTHLVEQGVLVGIGLVFTLKFLLPALLFLYFISSYVYLGTNPFWDFISASARNVLAPLRSLRLGKLDLAPVAGIALLLLVLHLLPSYLLAELARRNLTLWPR